MYVYYIRYCFETLNPIIFKKLTRTNEMSFTSSVKWDEDNLILNGHHIQHTPLGIASRVRFYLVKWNFFRYFLHTSFINLFCWCFCFYFPLKKGPTVLSALGVMLIYLSAFTSHQKNMHNDKRQNESVSHMLTHLH